MERWKALEEAVEASHNAWQKYRDVWVHPILSAPHETVTVEDDGDCFRAWCRSSEGYLAVYPAATAAVAVLLADEMVSAAWT